MDNFFQKIELNIKLGEKFHSYEVRVVMIRLHIYVYDKTVSDGHLLFTYDYRNDSFEMNGYKYTEQQILKMLNLLTFI